MLPTASFATRGLIEGFDGRPWSWAERHRMLDFLRDQGYNAYLYAPKGDPLHHRRWRAPYTGPEGQAFEQLNAQARACGVQLIFGLSTPGLRPRDPDDLRALRAKFGQAARHGFGSFALLLDDRPSTAEPHGDAAGSGPLAQAQAVLANTLAEALPGPLALKPGRAPDDRAYLRELSAGLAPQIAVFWTACRSASPSLDAFTASSQRPLLIWDDGPVHEPNRRGDAHRTLLLGQAAAFSGSFVAASPGAERSKLTLHATAAALRDPAGHDPVQAARAAAQALTDRPEEAEAVLLLADLAWRALLPASGTVEGTLWPALDAFWAARGGPPPEEQAELEGRPAAGLVHPDETPLRQAAVRLELAAETLAHLGNRDLRRDLTPWTHALAGWARVLKYALAALDHPHDARARDYVLDELGLMRDHVHSVVGDALDHFGRRCVWAAERAGRA